MKKLVLVASLFLAIATSAQKRQSNEQNQKPNVEHQMKDFDDLNLNDKQRKNIKALYEERNNSDSKSHPNKPNSQVKGGSQQGKNQNDFDARVQKILTKNQYAKYKAKKKSGVKNNQGKKKEINKHQ